MACGRVNMLCAAFNHVIVIVLNDCFVFLLLFLSFSVYQDVLCPR